MQDIVTILRGDRAEADPFLTDEPQPPAVLDRLRTLLEHHCELEDTLLFPALVAAGQEWDGPVARAMGEHEQILAELARARTSGTSLSPDLVDLLRAHLEDDEATFLAPAARDLSDDARRELARNAPSLPQPDQEALAAGDVGASSDGDTSWARTPLTQDPELDRSVDATISRTGGR